MTQEHETTAILTAIGPDRKGLVNSVTRFIASKDCNIEAARMETLGGLFAA